MIENAPGTQSVCAGSIGSAHVLSKLPKRRDFGNLFAKPVNTKKSVRRVGNIRADGCHELSRPTSLAPARPTVGCWSMCQTASARALRQRKASELSNAE